MIEIGNALFGNSRGEAQFPRTAAWESPFRDLLARCGLDDHGLGIDDEKRGFENDVFKIEPYYWGECDCPEPEEDDDEEVHVDDCPARAPNFLFKATGFRIEWYKYPFRDSYMTPGITLQQWRKIMDACRASIPVG